MQRPVCSESLRTLIRCGCLQHHNRAAAAFVRTQRLRACHECGEWRQLSGASSIRLRLRDVHADRKQQLYSSSDEVQPSLDAFLEQPGASGLPSGSGSADVPGVPPPVLLEADIDLRERPWAWRRRTLAQMGRFCGEKLLT
jgi:hypothetical protein